MTTSIPRTQLQLRSLARRNGELELSLAEIPMPRPGPREVLVRVEASPLNPSDHGLLFVGADMEAAIASGTVARPIVTAPIPPATLKRLTGRLDESMPVGNEGAGVVVETGEAEEARVLMGKRVAMFGGAMYSQYRSIGAEQCLSLPEGATCADGASAFVNPMTTLGMIDTMRREGHKALVHTAAASNVGQILQRLCTEENIKLVNIVRSDDQEKLLRGMGAIHVCSTRSPQFAEDLAAAMAATNATIAFDAIGGGVLADQILKAMEAAAGKTGEPYSRYGSTTHKQVYMYGGLDPGPTQLSRDYGMAWGIGGWLVMAFMQKIGPTALAELKARIARELKSTFASKYSREISLAETLALPIIAAYRRRETGQKYLVNPNRSSA